MQVLTKEKISEMRKKLEEHALLNEPPTPPSRPDAIIVSGGELVQSGDNVIYYGNNGSIVTFKGVDYSIDKILIAPDSAYQLNGTIHISESWLKNGFNVYDFAHEYGHYIQQEEMGNFKYYGYAVQSMYYLKYYPEEHSSLPFEKDATTLGYNYLINNTRYPGMP